MIVILRKIVNRVTCKARVLEVLRLILIAKGSWKGQECVWIKGEA